MQGRPRTSFFHTIINTVYFKSYGVIRKVIIDGTTRHCLQRVKKNMISPQCSAHFSLYVDYINEDRNKLDWCMKHVYHNHYRNTVTYSDILCAIYITHKLSILKSTYSESQSNNSLLP